MKTDRQRDLDLMSHEFTMGMKDYLTIEDIREEIRLLADSMSTRSAFAKLVGISPQYLCDIILGRRDPGKKIAKFLKVKKTVVYLSTEDINDDHQ